MPKSQMKLLYANVAHLWKQKMRKYVYVKRPSMPKPHLKALS